ncbi:2-hydroxyacid dehydrogenase [Cesiribacter andamanensis]|uniref:D-lactate dehydrogenase n=1 Tax=Cesiribacter andamanensis AMV16 TaxID=1279009 RepID=M7N9K2_9BACT|nr:2-hydroxyacid dehydrogenase [Cesiribacter andamanensis]EMR03876.1 D-lactate dehydrogenase [Cesiribacter andamanensis AMV16]
MNIVFFSTKAYDKEFFSRANATHGFALHFLEVPLNPTTALLAQGHEVVCVFVNDVVGAETLNVLARQGVKLLALRCAGYNNVDLKAASALGIQVVRVPAYSPHSVAEHTLALILTLNRKTHRAYNRVKEGNFSLHGLMGFDLFGKTAGLIGLGKIGLVTARILKGFGCRVLGYDIQKPQEADAIGIDFTSLEALYAQSDIISLHCPLTPDTYHLINEESIRLMKKGVMLINTSRGALIDTRAVIDGLKSEHIRYLGVDVYEEEADLFFEDLSNRVIQDDVFMRLLSFNNVLITGHQAFLPAMPSAALPRLPSKILPSTADRSSCRMRLRQANVYPIPDTPLSWPTYLRCSPLPC